MAIISSILAACIAVWLGSRRLLTTRRRLAWIFLGIGLLLWAGSNLDSYVNLTLALPTSSWVTILDSCYLAGQSLVLLSLVLFLTQVRRTSSQIRLYGDVFIALVAAATLSWLVILRPFQDIAGQLDIYNARLFPLTGLVLLIAIMILFMLEDLQRRSPGQRWIHVGLLLLVMSDLVRDYLSLVSGNVMANPNNLVWASGCFSIILAAVRSYRQITPVKNPKATPGKPGATDRSILETGKQTLAKLDNFLTKGFQATIVFLANFLLGGYALSGWSLIGGTETFGLWITLLLGLFLIARQGMLAGEREFRQYTLLVDSIAEPAFICDGKGRLKLVNPALLSSMGYKDNHALLNKSVLCMISASSLPDHFLQSAIPHGWSGEIVFERMDGSTYPGYLSLRPINRSPFEHLTLAGTAHDLSVQNAQQKALQIAYDQAASAHHELEMMNAQLEQKVAEKTSSLSTAYQTLEQQNQTLQMLDGLKSDFVSLVSHELRAPLTNISGGIELVLSSPQAIPDHVQLSLTLVQSEILRLTHFVETILDLSALDAGRMPFSAAPLALIDIVDMLDYQVKMMRSGERVRWSIPDGLPLINIDEHALESILFHLVDNAIKYAQKGEILVTAYTESNLVYVQVIDEGEGISPEALPMLFKRFSRLQHGDAQTVYGHGLGLYIVRRLLQAMDGDVRYEKTPDGRSCFTFWLPAIEDKDESEIAVS